jgi:hypothetical protein
LSPLLPEGSDEDEDEEFDAVAAAALPGVPGSAVEKCDAFRQYSSAKLSLLSFSAELERRLRKSPKYAGIVSHAVNPGPTATGFDSAPPAGRGQVPLLGGF